MVKGSIISGGRVDIFFSHQPVKVFYPLPINFAIRPCCFSILRSLMYNNVLLQWASTFIVRDLLFIPARASVKNLSLFNIFSIRRVLGTSHRSRIRQDWLPAGPERKRIGQVAVNTLTRKPPNWTVTYNPFHARTNTLGYSLAIYMWCDINFGYPTCHQTKSPNNTPILYYMLVQPSECTSLYGQSVD